MDRGLLQKDLASHFNVSECTIGNWEKDGRILRMKLAREVLDFIGHDPLIPKGSDLLSRMKRAQRKSGLNLRQVADIIMLDPSHLGRVLKGVYRPMPQTEKRLNEFLESWENNI